jgi:hypothetical protein
LTQSESTGEDPLNGIVGEIEDPVNTSRPTLRNLKSHSNATDGKRPQFLEHLGPRNLTDEGITMHINPLKENASS